MLLQRWIDTGFSGDLSLTPADAYQALTLPNREIGDDSVSAAYQVAIMDQPENRAYFARCLEVIAEDRNSAVLRDLLHDAQPTQPVRDDEPVGLDNIGNTCYLNSLLQFLFTVVELRRIVLDFDNFKMDMTESNLALKKVGQRKVTKREVQTAQDFVANLGQLFRGMIESANPTIRPEKELARLTLETHGAKEKLRRRSTLLSDRPSLGHIDSQPLIGPLPQSDQPELMAVDEEPMVQSPEKEEATPMSIDGSNSMEDSPVHVDGQNDNSSEATLVSRPGSPSTPITAEQQREILDNKENLSPTKLDTSAKNDDEGGEHPEPLAPASPSKVNAQAGTLIAHEKAREAVRHEVPLIEATPKYAPPPGKPPPVPPRKPLEPATDILEEYARQQDVTEVIAHCLFQFSCAIRGTGVDASGEQIDELHDTFFGQNISHTIPEREPPQPIQFNSIITRVANKPRDVYEALDSELDLTDREGASKAFSSISKLPPIFSLALDRVAWDKSAGRAMKQDDHVEMHERIYLDRYLEADLDSDLMTRRKQTWSMKAELASLVTRRDKLETKTANGSNIPNLFADAKTALDYLQTNPDFMLTDDGSPEDELPALDPAIADALGALAQDLAEELEKITHRIAYLEQQLKEAFSDMRDHPYRLHAAFFHRGGATGGHYWVYIYDHVKECWRRYNDERVSTVNDRNEIFGKPTGTAGAANPYFLVYVREDKVKELVETVKRNIVFTVPEGPPPDHSHAQSFPNAQPRSQMEAMPPGSLREMVEVNGGINAWTAGEYSDSGVPDTRNAAEPRGPNAGREGAWDDSQLTDGERIKW
jgi:ubiquitin carboxyl-terminal hydrolase 25